MDKIEISHERFGYLLEAHLADKGMQNRELAEKIGAANSSVSYYKKSAYPGMDKFVAILNALEITPNQFFQIEEEEKPQKTVYVERKPEKSEWVQDQNGVYYCRCCRMDAPYDKEGKQRRPKYCPWCGRFAWPEVKNND